MSSQQSENSHVVGRYAPSPTGDLHLGNLRTALIAWLQARSQGGKFLMRMEDTDTPRVVVGSDLRILKDLEWLGLDWDESVIYQSARLELYQAAIEQLRESGLVYPCFCSRKDIRLAGSAPHAQPGVYPGICSNLNTEEIRQRSIVKQPAYRLRVSADLKEKCGDFVLLRADGIVAYQLAVVVDDLEQGITDVVRGADLIDSTDRQLYLAQQLHANGRAIQYHHIPLMLDNAGNRLSKRDGSLSVKQWRAQGGTNASMLGMFAEQLGLQESSTPISAEELLCVVRTEQITSLAIEH
ncbi:MAG: tRNA glutamyl-Q(34) synthetase GluQRS [Gammaproteobacteria bacterium]|nr:tRNA glutamyl-Q(34) synthetase GluQRS [Gammaproteobacteria bacterium]